MTSHGLGVIAEISNNHNGSLALAKRLIRGCAAAGADYVKFQCYTPDELVLLRGNGPAPDPWGSDGWTMRDLYKQAQTPHAWFPDLVAECEAAGVAWFSSVFGLDSLHLLEGLGCPMYKIAALDAQSRWLWQAVRETGKPTVRSQRTPVPLEAHVTLFCPEGYPQDWKRRRIPLGFDGVSYHGTEWQVAAPLWLETGTIEVHVQLDDTPSELEAGVSLTVSDLVRLCRSAG